MTILPTQSAATPPRSGQQPGPARRPSPVQAAPFPTPQAHPSQASAGNSASSGSSAPPFLIHDEDSDIDPAFFAAWRETQYGPNDMEAR